MAAMADCTAIENSERAGPETTSGPARSVYPPPIALFPTSYLKSFFGVLSIV
jgi:hypothetical protein